MNEEKKEKLKAAKDKLAEVHNNIRLLAPMVEQGTPIDRDVHVIFTLIIMGRLSAS